jgi:adenosylcobinamide-GDP ribazoletransferase
LLSALHREWGLLRAAVQALTRIPVPAPHGPDTLRRAVRYFPVVGAGVGAIGALVFWLAGQGLPAMAASVLSLAATAVLTGALHEDGLADCCDGLLGGRTRDDALRIMRDSRLGAFGAIGLFLVLGLKLSLVAAMPQVGLTLIAAHAAGRFWAVLPTALLPYARPDGMAAQIAGPDAATLAVAALLGLGPLLLLGPRALPALLLSGGVALLFGLFVRRRLGGYTGDALGATQVLTEIAVLLAAAWRAG